MTEKRSFKGIELTVRVEARGAGRNRRYAGFLWADGEVIDSKHALTTKNAEAEQAAREWLRSYTDAQLQRLIEETLEGELEVAARLEEEAREKRAVVARLGGKLRGGWGRCISGHPSCPGPGVCPDWVDG